MRVEDFIIDEDASLMEAMKALDATGQRILFVAPDGRLKAAITDGDLRKFILRGGDLRQPLREAANYNPISLGLGERHKVKSELLRLQIDAIPLLNKKGVISDIEFANDFDIVSHGQISCPVVIQAGGLGTRLYPYTKILPKPLIPIGDIPISEEIIQRFSNHGCKSFYMVVNYKKGMIKSYFADVEKDYEISFVDEDIPLGTGGGLSMLKEELNETFFLTNCDILIDADYGDIYQAHKESKNMITIVCALKNIVIPYGVVELGEDGEIANITEKPEMNFLTNTGLYVVEPEVAKELTDGEFINFTDIIEKYRLPTNKVGVYPVRENSWMDMGQLEELESMRRRLKDV